MAGKSKIKIQNHLTINEINKLIIDLKIEVNLYKRLFLKSIQKKGMPIKHAAELVGVNRVIGISLDNPM